ncbi:MAG: hypothetical protein ACXADO_11050 [Candidatus Thorarchaeota archaeon]
MLEKLEGIKAALSTRTYLIVKQELEDLKAKGKMRTKIETREELLELCTVPQTAYSIICKVNLSSSRGYLSLLLREGLLRRFQKQNGEKMFKTTLRGLRVLGRDPNLLPMELLPKILTFMHQNRIVVAKKQEILEWIQ